MPDRHDNEYLLKSDTELEWSAVVANSAMNRLRGLSGANSYAQELGFDPLDWLRSRPTPGRSPRWLDLCCGEGRALIEADHEAGESVDLVGLDLVDYFDAAAGSSRPEFVVASVMHWQPAGQFDLITCVHGLHYVGDKLGLLDRVVSWLEPDGLFLGHLDPHDIVVEGRTDDRRLLVADLCEAGFTWNNDTHLLRADGARSVSLPYQYRGADDRCGPNFTGQPSVRSHYQRP